MLDIIVGGDFGTKFTLAHTELIEATAFVALKSKVRTNAQAQFRV